MMGNLFRARSTPAAAPAGDPHALFCALARARGAPPYTEQDRRRDFRRVFLASAAGKRVLHEIFASTHLFAATFVPGDAFATHWREGGRDVGLRILTMLDTDAPDGPGAEAEEADPDGDGA